MEGTADPDNRRAFPPAGTPLPEDAVATRAFVRATVHARRSHVALRRGEMRIVATGPRWIALERRAEGHRALVAVNAGEESATIGLGAVAAGLDPLALPNLTDAVSGTTITLPSLDGIVLVDDP
jgi:hypothetical protein